MSNAIRLAAMVHQLVLPNWDDI